MAKTLKVIVKTLSGTSAQALGTQYVPTGSLIHADSGDTVYIGQSDVSTTTGFLLPTTPMKLSDFVTGGDTEEINLSTVYVIGADADKVRILYVADV